MSKLLVKRSNCCNSGVVVQYSCGSRATRYYVNPHHKCLECNQPCDVHIETWDVDGMGEDEKAKDND